MTCARIDTSRAETGSSAMISLGAGRAGQLTAAAAPENRAVAVDVLATVDEFQQFAHPL
jgi:hypothetical protein